MVNMTFGNQKKFKLRPALILLFFFGGIAEFSNKIYQQYGVGDYKDLFLLCVFFVAFLISLSYTIHQRSKATKRDILTGFAVGIPNLFSSYFLILSLATVKTSVAFPLYSAGSILLITIGGRVIFGEAISAKNKLAIALTVIALILVNLP
jgi:multidrug transporter EmrE-like cation transporter